MSKENNVKIVAYNRDLQRLGVVDVFRSLIWTRKYFECGTFELHAPLNARNLPSILTFCKMYCAYKLNKQGDNIQS